MRPTHSCSECDCLTSLQLGVALDAVWMAAVDKLLVGTLPYPTVLRVLDIFVSDGIKTLLRIGLGLVSIAAPSLLQVPPAH